MVFIRTGSLADAQQVFVLAVDFATSFRPEWEVFQQSFARLIAEESARVLVAEDAGAVVGYLLGFTRETFYANGPIAWVEEIAVQRERRRRGVGRRLMEAFEAHARDRRCALIALATRRAAEFYQALDYDESASYFRKILPGR